LLKLWNKEQFNYRETKPKNVI